MLEKNVSMYNEIVDLVENCSYDLLDIVNMPIENNDMNDLFSYFNQRLSYFSLEVLSKFSH